MWSHAPRAAGHARVRRYFNSTFASLATRNYRLYFIGQLISVTGNRMQMLAQAWLVLELTDSGTWLGLVMAVQQLPALLLSSWGGLLADRYQKRKILMLVTAAGAVPALLLGVLSLTGHISVAVVMVLAATIGVIDAIEKPARHSFPSEMVPRHLLTNAVTLNNVVLDSGKATGPAIAALLIAGVGLPYAFLINAVTFAAAFLGLFLMNPAELDIPIAARRQRGQVRAGLQYVRGTPHLLGPLALLATVGLLAYNLQVLLPLLGRNTFNGDARTVGYLIAALGFGSVLGGLSLAGLLKPNLNRIVASAFLVAGVYVVTSLSPTFAVALGLVFVMGITNLVFKTLASTWLQLTAEPMMRGRVLSLLVLATAGTSPLGAPLVGWIANTYGTRVSFMVAGIGSAVAAALTYVYLGRVNGLRPLHNAQLRPAHTTATGTAAADVASSSDLKAPGGL